MVEGLVCHNGSNEGRGSTTVLSKYVLLHTAAVVLTSLVFSI